MAMLNGCLNIAAGIAPVIGSYITLYFHWRGNFSALLILGCVTLVMTLLFISKDSPKQFKKDLSFASYKKPLRSKPLLLLIGSIILIFLPYWVFVGISPLLYIKSLHVTLKFFGFYQGVLAFSFAIGSILLGLVINKLSQRRWLWITLVIFVLSLLAIVYTSLFASHSPIMITFSMLLFVLGQIIPSIILYPLCLNYMPDAKGKIVALQQAGRLIFSALALQVTGYFYHGSFDDTGYIIALIIALIIVTQLMILKNKHIKLNA